MLLFRPARILGIAWVLALLAACGGGDGGSGPARVATSVTISPSAGNSVQSGGTLQLTAVVRDQNGAVMTGQTVTWTSSNTARATVSQSGLVSGLTVGSITVTASVGAVSSTPVTVLVTAGPPASLTRVAELPATMPAGSGDTVRVRVLDANGNAVPGVTVSFAVTGAGSTLSAPTAVTDANGVASVRVVLGTAGGQVTTVTASAGSLAPVTFTTTGTLVVTSITISAPATTLSQGGTLQFTAVVRDQFGNVMSGQSPNWSSSNTAIASISTAGLLTAHTSGTVNVTASIGSVVSNVISVTVNSGPPASFVKVAELAGTMAAGSTDSVRTRVLDAGGNGVAGITVTFGVSGGSSTLSSTSRVTDANGFAAVRLTVGGTSGQVVTVTASVSGLPNLTFTTTIVAGAPSRVSITSPRTVIVNQGATTTVTAVVTDAFGNTTSGSVSYITRNASIATVSGAVVTGASLGQTFVVGRLTSDTTVRDSALIVVAHPTGPVVLSSLTRFDLKADTTFTVSIIVDMRASGEKLGSTRVQVSWNPAVLTYLSDAEGASSVGATVNSSAAVSNGILTLAVASSGGFSGSVEIRRVTFRATATTGSVTALTLAATELNGVSPNFTDLKPKTVGVSHPIYTR